MNKSLIIAFLFSWSLVNCSGVAQKIGNLTFYNDNSGNSYTSHSIGDLDFVSGSNGYSGCGQSIGDLYFYND